MSTENLENMLYDNGEDRDKIIEVDEKEVQLVVFSLGNEQYAMLGRYIKEVLGDTRVYFIPGCAKNIEGVINLRGEVESAIRIHEIMGVPCPESCVSTRLLLAQVEDLRCAIRIDNIIDVCSVKESSVRPAPSTLPSTLQGLVSGLVDFPSGPVPLIDVPQLLVRICQQRSPESS